MTMPKAFARKDFVIQELTVSIGGGSAGHYLPADDTVLPPSPITPIAVVALNIDLFEAVRATVIDAVKEKRFEEIGRAFVADGSGGNAVIRAAIEKIGLAVVASAAYGALGGGSAGLPNPECGGTSLETIPPTITPVVNVGYEVHRVTELTRLKEQLSETVAFVDKAVAARAPRGSDVAVVRAQLEGALKSLPRADAAGR
jgi:hypothetical protein